MPDYMKLNESGYKKVNDKQYEAAFKDFDSSIKLNDAYWLSHANRGGCYYLQDKYELALNDFNKSIALQKNNSLALDGRALCKIELKDTIGAIADLKQAIKYNMSFYRAYTDLGLLYSRIDSCKEALPYLNVAIDKKAFNDCISKDELLYLKNKCEGSK